MVQVVDTDATAAQPPVPPPPPIGSNVGDLQLPTAKIFWRNVSMCTAKLMEPGPNADFSTCPELQPSDYVPHSSPWPMQNAAQRNIIVKATCYSPTFKVRNGHGCMGAWVHGCTGARVHGARVHGCTGARVHG